MATRKTSEAMAQTPLDEHWQAQVGTLNTPTTRALAQAAVEEELEEDETPADRVFAVLAGSRDSERASVKLYRVNGPQQYGWCEDFTVDQFEAGGFAMIRDKWGPGEYEIRLYDIRPGDGRFGVRAKPRITIEQSREANPVQAAQSSAPAVDPAMRELLAQMAQGQARMMELLAQRPDPMAAINQAVSLMATMRSVLVPESSAAPAKSGIMEAVAAIRELRAVADEINPKTGSDKDGDPDNLISQLPGILETVRAFAPGGAQHQASAPAAPSFPPVVLPPSLQGPASVPNAAEAPIHQSANGQVSFAQMNPADPSPAHASEGADMNALALLTLRGYLRTLCDMADAGKSVEDGAELIYQRLPDELIDLMELPNWFDLLAQVAPEAKAREAWFRAARDAALAKFEADAANEAK